MIVTNFPEITEPHYGLTRTLEGIGFSTAVSRIRETLAVEGFGVLTENDVKATLAKKIGADTRDYVILGACNPTLAHQALQAEPAIGLLLPCNVVVTVNDNGDAVVSAIDPLRMFEVVRREDIAPLANEVRVLLQRALDAL